MPGGVQVPQRVWVGSITAEQEVGGPQVTDRPPFRHCGGKSKERVSQQAPWAKAQSEEGCYPNHLTHPFHPASYPRIASGPRGRCGRTNPAALETWRRLADEDVGERAVAEIADWSHVRNHAR